MSDTLADRLVAFALTTRYEDLPREVVVEARRRLVDALGCAVGALDEPRFVDRAAGGRAISGLAVGQTDRRRHVRHPTGPPSPMAFISAISTATIPTSRSSRHTPATTGRPSWPPASSPAPTARPGSPPRRSPTKSSAGSATPPASGRGAGTTPPMARSRRPWRRPGCSGLSHEQTVHALGIAGTTGTALRLTRAGELSMWKGCAFAFAARNGLFATLLAADGMTGPAPLFEGEMGFLQQVSGPVFAAQTGRTDRRRLDAAQNLDQVRAGRVSQPVGDRRGFRVAAEDQRPVAASSRSRSPLFASPSRSSARIPRNGGPRPAKPPTIACLIARPSPWSTVRSRRDSSAPSGWRTRP